MVVAIAYLSPLVALVQFALDISQVRRSEKLPLLVCHQSVLHGTFSEGSGAALKVDVRADGRRSELHHIPNEVARVSVEGAASDTSKHDVVVVDDKAHVLAGRTNPCRDIAQPLAKVADDVVAPHRAADGSPAGGPSPGSRAASQSDFPAS